MPTEPDVDAVDDGQPAREFDFDSFTEALIERRLSVGTNAAASVMFGPGDNAQTWCATSDQVEMSLAVARAVLDAVDLLPQGSQAEAQPVHVDKIVVQPPAPTEAPDDRRDATEAAWYGKVKKAVLAEASIRYTLTPEDGHGRNVTIDVPPTHAPFVPGEYVTLHMSRSTEPEPEVEPVSVLDAFPWLAAVLSGDPLSIGQVVEILEGNGVYASEMTEEAAREALSRVVAARLHL